MRQVFTLLNSDAPRPGDLFRLPVGTPADEEVTIEATMPGGIDFEKGTTKVDFQMWPLFQAIDLDHILTCVEVALTNSGRVVFCSRHPAMLGSAVETLKYIVELRGWDGIALQNIHIRDVTFMIEDPGPYIIVSDMEWPQLTAGSVHRVPLRDHSSQRGGCRRPRPEHVDLQDASCWRLFVPQARQEPSQACGCHGICVPH